MELTLKTTTEDELGAPVSTEETVYTSTITDSLEENLLQVSVSVSQPVVTQTEVVSSEINDPTVIQPSVEVSETGQMWSAGQHQQDQRSSSLLILGDGDAPATGDGKDQLIGGDVQEEVELLVNQEQ